MPSTLEQVGGAHGQILRDFLGAGHNADGSVRVSGGADKLTPSTAVKSMVDAAVMASPPTVTLGGTATAIASGVFIAPNDSRFRVCGTVLEVTGIGTDRGLCYSRKKQYKAVQQPGTATDVGGPFYIGFQFEGTKFEFLCKNFAMPFRIWVNEQPSSATPTVTPAGGTNNYVSVDFGTRGRRRIMIEYMGGTTAGGPHNVQTFGGIMIGPTDSLTPSPVGAAGRIIFIGDSFVLGAASTYYAPSFVQRAGWSLGIDDVWNQGLSGTGFINANVPSNFATYGQRVATDLYPFNPDIVVLNVSTNDDGQAAGVLQAEVTRLLTEIRQNLPNAVVICLGHLYLGNFTGTRTTAFNEGKAGALAVPGVTFVDTQNPPWSTGTGKLGATTGNGPADFYVAADGVHPSDAGHVFLGDRVAAAIAQAARIGTR